MPQGFPQALYSRLIVKHWQIFQKSLARSFVLGQGTEKFCETPPHLFMHTTEYIDSRNSQPGVPPCAQQKGFVHGTRPMTPTHNAARLGSALSITSLVALTYTVLPSFANAPACCLFRPLIESRCQSRLLNCYFLHTSTAPRCCSPGTPQLLLDIGSAETSREPCSYTAQESTYKMLLKMLASLKSLAVNKSQIT